MSTQTFVAWSKGKKSAVVIWHVSKSCLRVFGCKSCLRVFECKSCLRVFECKSCLRVFECKSCLRVFECKSCLRVFECKSCLRVFEWHLTAACFAPPRTLCVVLAAPWLPASTDSDLSMETTSKHGRLNTQKSDAEVSIAKISLKTQPKTS